MSAFAWLTLGAFAFGFYLLGSTALAVRAIMAEMDRAREEE